MPSVLIQPTLQLTETGDLLKNLSENVSHNLSRVISEV